MIMDPKQTGMLSEVVAEGGYYGMQTFDQHLLEHVNAGRVTMEDATRAAPSPHDFKLMLAAQARISPRSHPNKGAGEIAGAPADSTQVAPMPTDAPPAAPAPAVPAAEQAPAAPPAATQPPLPPAAPQAPSGAPPTPSAPPPGIPS
jgi:twitching motility protein PilT